MDPFITDFTNRAAAPCYLIGKIFFPRNVLYFSKLMLYILCPWTETLIHSTTQPCEDADFTFKIFFNMGEHTVYVRKRPFLKTFLERVSEMFEIVIFTASESVYAGQLLDILDPEGKFFSRRVYRDSCIVINGNYTKDLTILGVDLAKCAIVDNCPQVPSPSSLHLFI